MLELHSGQTGEKIIVTLTELTTLSNPYYLFVFTHTETKNVVAFVVGADESPYPERYNQFTVSAALFNPDGYWLYEVHEQESSTNTDSAASGAIVEYGKMILYKVDEFEYQQYNEPVTYKAYNG